jgi:hypothetical protein
MSNSRKRSAVTADQLRAEHQREHSEHLDWREDLKRWRQEYTRAVLEFVRRKVPELEIVSYEAAFDSHEAAIEAHEEMLRRHERMLAVEARGGPVTSDEIARFQALVEDRHGRSLETHRLLEITHGTILRALRMMSRDAGDRQPGLLADRSTEPPRARAGREGRQD